MLSITNHYRLWLATWCCCFSAISLLHCYFTVLLLVLVLVFVPVQCWYLFPPACFVDLIATIFVWIISWLSLFWLVSLWMPFLHHHGYSCYYYSGNMILSLLWISSSSSQHLFSMVFPWKSHGGFLSTARCHGSKRCLGAQSSCPLRDIMYIYIHV